MGFNGSVWKGQKLKIGVTSVWWPWLAECAALPKSITLQRTKRCYFPGFSNEIFGYVLDVMGLVQDRDYELVSMPDITDWGHAPKGNDTQWSGLLGLLQNGSIDGINSLWNINPVREKYFQFSYPATYLPSGFVYRGSVNQAEDLYTLFKVFTISVWGLLALSLLTLIILLCLNDQIFGRAKTAAGQLFDSFFTTVRFIVNDTNVNHNAEDRKTHTSRWILATLGLACVFLISYYESMLLTFLIRQVQSVPFETTSEAAPYLERGDYRIIDYSTSAHYISYVKSSALPNMMALAQVFQDKPSSLVVEPEGLKRIGERLMEDGSLAFHAEYLAAATLVSTNCGLVYHYDDEFPMAKLAFLFRKDQTEFVERFSEAIKTTYPFINQAVDRYVKIGDKLCLASSEPAGLKIRNFYAIFVLVALGFIAGLASFLVEQRRRQQDKSIHPLFKNSKHKPLRRFSR